MINTETTEYMNALHAYVVDKQNLMNNTDLHLIYNKY